MGSRLAAACTPEARSSNMCLIADSASALPHAGRRSAASSVNASAAMAFSVSLMSRGHMSLLPPALPAAAPPCSSACALL